MFLSPTSNKTHFKKGKIFIVIFGKDMTFFIVFYWKIKSYCQRTMLAEVLDISLD